MRVTIDGRTFDRLWVGMQSTDHDDLTARGYREVARQERERGRTLALLAAELEPHETVPDAMQIKR